MTPSEPEGPSTMDAAESAARSAREQTADHPPTAVQPCPETTVNPNANTTVSGNRIDVEFDPSKSKKVKDCTKIAHVQVIQMLADGKPIVPGTYYSGYSYRDSTTLDNGMYVDQLETMTSPDPASVGIGSYGNKNGGTTSAKFFDAPNTGGGDKGFYDKTANKTGWKTVKYKFWLFPFCMGGPDCGQWYEGLTWEYKKTWKDNRDGKTGVSKVTKKSVSKPSKQFIKAFDKFNTDKGFTPCP